MSEPGPSGRIGRAGPARHASLHLEPGGPAERAWRGSELAAVVRRRAAELRRTLPPPAECGIVALERARPAELLVDVLAALDAGLEAFPLNAGWWPRDRDAVLEALRPAWRLGRAGEPDRPVPSGLAWTGGSDDDRLAGADERPNRPALWMATAGPSGDPSPFGFSGEHVARWSVPSGAVRAGARVLIVGSPGHGPVLREALSALLAGADVQLTDRAHLAGHLTAGPIDRLVVAAPVLRVVLRHLARRGRAVVGVGTTITHQGPVRPHERAAWVAALGGDLVEAISVTEAGGWLAVAGSVPDGLLARPHGAARVGDPAPPAGPDAGDGGGAGRGHPVPPGTGQLHVDGPGAALLGATDARPAGGWPTGDLVQVGPAGRLAWLGRARDRFLVGGDEVDPVAVEAVIAAHPLVADVAVAPRPHPELGSVVAAVVVPHEPSWPPFLDDLAAVTAALPFLQRPRALAIVDDLPLHAGGGLHRRLVAFEEAGR